MILRKINRKKRYLKRNWHKTDFFHQILFCQLNGKWSKVRQCRIWLVHKEGGPAKFFYNLRIIFQIYFTYMIVIMMMIMMIMMMMVKMIMIISIIIVITCVEPQRGVETSWVIVIMIIMMLTIIMIMMVNWSWLWCWWWSSQPPVLNHRVGWKHLG